MASFRKIKKPAKVITFDDENEGLDNAEKIDKSKVNESTGQNQQSNDYGDNGTNHIAIQQPKQTIKEKKVYANTIEVFKDEEDNLKIFAKKIQSAAVISKSLPEFTNIIKTTTKSYTKEYIDELLKINQKSNENTLSIIRSIEETQQIREEEDEDNVKNEEKFEMDRENAQSSDINIDNEEAKESIIEETVALESNELIIEEIKQTKDSDHEDFGQDKQFDIKKAKEVRSKRRKLNSGEFIPIEPEIYLDTKSDNRRIPMSLETAKHPQKLREEISLSSEGGDSEEEEEFNKWENHLINRAINPRVKQKFQSMNILPKKGIEELDMKSETKILEFKEIDYEFLMQRISENLATKVAIFDQNKTKIDQIEGLITQSETDIHKYTTEYTEQAKNHEILQTLFEYFNDFADMMTEKLLAINEAEMTLLKIEENYKKLHLEKLKTDISDELEDNGGQRIDMNPNETLIDELGRDLNYVKLSQKSQRKSQRMKKYMNQNSNMNGDENDKLDIDMDIYLSDEIDNDINNKDIDLINLSDDKVAIYEGAIDIFSDVIEDYTSISNILTKIFNVSLNCQNITEEKLIEWGYDCLSPYCMIDMIGYDPLGYTHKEFKYHKKIDYNEYGVLYHMNQWLILSNIDNPNTIDANKSASNAVDNDNNGLNIEHQQEQRKKFIDKLRIRLLENIVKNKLIKIIEYLWDPFSRKQTFKVTSILNLFIDLIYKNNREKNKNILEKIKEILSAVTSKLKEAIDYIIFPPTVNNTYSKHTLHKALRLAENTFAFEGILPLTNIKQISLQEIINPKILKTLKELPNEYSVNFVNNMIRYSIPSKIIESMNGFEQILKLNPNLNVDTKEVNQQKILKYIVNISDREKNT